MQTFIVTHTSLIRWARYRLPAAEILRGQSWLDLIFIRIACLHCHILCLPCTLYWRQFSAAVDPVVTAWFFVHGSRVTPGGRLSVQSPLQAPPVADLLQTGLFCLFPESRRETRSAAVMGPAFYRIIGTLARVKHCSQQTWDVQVTYI